MIPLRPVERVCICVGGPRAQGGSAAHEPACNERHAATFFATVAMVREDSSAVIARWVRVA